MNDFEDLSELCTGTSENEGVWIPVVLYGKRYNMKALVYGESSDAVQKKVRENLREKMKSLNVSGRGGNLSFDEEGLDDIVNDDGIDNCLLRLGGLVKLDGSPLKYNGADVPESKSEKGAEEIYRGILRGMPELADFIMRTAKERANFLPGRKES